MAKSNNSSSLRGIGELSDSGYNWDSFLPGTTLVSPDGRFGFVETGISKQATTTDFMPGVIFRKPGQVPKPVSGKGGKQGQSGSASGAVQAFLPAIQIEDLDVSGYTGTIGEKIVIRITGDFLIHSLQLMIENYDTSYVEQGSANPGADSALWEYTVHATNSSLYGDRITVTARDILGRDTVFVRTL